MKKSLIFISILILAVSVCAADSKKKPRINGYTDAVSNVQTGLPDAGVIYGVNVHEGQYVKKGQIILYADKKLEELEVTRRALLADNDSEINFANRKVNTLKKQLDSEKKLLNDSGAISVEEYDNKELSYEEALATADKLKKDKRLHQIELAIAKQQLARKILVSPVNGFIVNIIKKQGESVQAHEPLVRIADAHTGIFIGNAEQSLAGKLSVGQKVTVTIKTVTGTVNKEAKIIFISPAVDTASGLLKIKAGFDNSKSTIRLGGSAYIEM